VVLPEIRARPKRCDRDAQGESERKSAGREQSEPLQRQGQTRSEVTLRLGLH